MTLRGEGWVVAPSSLQKLQRAVPREMNTRGMTTSMEGCRVGVKREAHVG
jgi:hypothetical protein